MAGYSKIYCVGDLSGPTGYDGINPIEMQIWVGDSDRQWLEARYFNVDIGPIGSIRVIVPQSADHPNALLDACLAFYPKAFSDCPSMAVVQAKLAHHERLDFHQGKDEIPLEWQQLRGEALGPFRKLQIFEAELRKVQPE